ncbi:MAG: DUF2142 domain-containing protein, partial [Anaerolineales bacterium]|nr:DUF2142 domain-containing protein [Anaerolineales bacterium]
IKQAIMGLFLLLGLTYAYVTPPFEASDELWHYPMIQYLAEGNPLPVQVFDPALAGPWKQQASQPPLYYYLGAALTFWLDQSDMDAVRHLNPHVEPGVLTSDGNRNLAVHDPDASPWQGALLAVYIVRTASVLLGLATVYLTFRLGRLLLPDRPDLALVGMAVLAFTPMFLFISGAINSDNLIIPLAAWACLLMIQLVATPPQTAAARLRRYGGLGIVIGLAALAKIPGTGLLPLALGTAFIESWHRLDRPVTLRELLLVARATVASFLWLLLPALLIAGWWYWRNVQLYGDWRGWSAFIAVLGQRSQPASLGQLWDERWGFMASYWGMFGGLNIALPTWAYYLLNALVVVAVPGFLVYFLPRIWRWWQAIRLPAQPLAKAIKGLLVGVTAFFPWVIALLWCAAIIVGLIQWATTTWSSQGRLVFYALPFLQILLVTGLLGWLPRPAGRSIGLGFAGLLFGLSCLAPWLWIRPTYQPNLGCGTPTHAVDQLYGDQIRLIGFDGDLATAHPGENLNLRLYWQVTAPMVTDWSVFVHLNDPVLQIPVAQRDMYLGQGLLATSFLQPGDCVENEYTLHIPETAGAPAELELVTGLYDFDTFTRLSTNAGTEVARLASLQLEPRPGVYPNATEVNFGDKFLLVGYELSQRRARPGESLTLTTYWQPLAPPAGQYTFFAQVLADFGGSNTRWAAFDNTPPEGTMSWSTDEVYRVELPLQLAEGAPAGILPIIIGAYTRTDEGGFANLQLVTADGRLSNENLWSLTQIRIDE